MHKINSTQIKRLFIVSVLLFNSLAYAEDDIRALLLEEDISEFNDDQKVRNKLLGLIKNDEIDSIEFINRQLQTLQ